MDKRLHVQIRTSDLASLALVPLVHLLDGQEACARRGIGKVAYGSRNWQLFKELDVRR